MTHRNASAAALNPITFTDDRVFRLGTQMSCGFSFRRAEELKEAWGGEGRSPYYVFIYLLKGKGVYEDENGNRFALSPGTFYQRFPGILHSNHFEPNEDFSECFMTLPAEMFPVLLATKTISLQRPGFTLGVVPAICERFVTIYEHLKDCPEQSLHTVLAEMHVFATELLSLASANQASDPFLEKAITLLMKDLAGSCSLPALAKSLGVSYSYFRRHFHVLTGISPAAYRLEKRMELAQQLLMEAPAQIKNVARDVGYPDVYSFSKQFKRHTGITPGQFAKSRQMGMIALK